MPVARLDAVDVALAAVLVICAATDLRTGRIYNAVTYPAILLGFVCALLQVGPGLSSSVLGFIVGGLPLYLFFVAGWMGGGDVKLMAAVGALKGFPFILHAMFYSIFLGGVCAALALIWGGHGRAVLTDLVVFVRGMAGAPGFDRRAIVPRGGSFPFGVAICIGTLTALVLEWTH